MAKFLVHIEPQQWSTEETRDKLLQHIDHVLSETGYKHHVLLGPGDLRRLPEGDFIFEVEGETTADFVAERVAELLRKHDVIMATILVAQVAGIAYHMLAMETIIAK